MNLIPGYIVVTSSRSVKLFSVPSFDSERHLSTNQQANNEPVYSAHELHLPASTANHTFIRCSSITSGYTPLRGYQPFPLVITVAKQTLVFQPSSSSCPDAESPDAITPPYTSPAIETSSPRTSLYIKLGSEGKRALLKSAPGPRPMLQPGWHKLAVLSVTDGGSDARLGWENSVDSPLTSAVAFDEVSGRLYRLGNGRVEVHDLF